MARSVTIEPSATDELLDRLDRIAAEVIGVRAAVASLEGPRFDGLRWRTDLLLEDVGRCLARELGGVGGSGAGRPTGGRAD